MHTLRLYTRIVHEFEQNYELSGGGKYMRIAVACTGLDVAYRFDYSENFTFYTVTNGIIVECQSIPFQTLTASSAVDFFKSMDVVALICNTINIDHARIFCSANIEVVAAVSGNARSAVEKYLTKTLIGADEMCHGSEDDEASCCAISSCSL